MSTVSKGKLIIAAITSRPYVEAAVRAGFEVVAIDAFADTDVQKLATHCYQIGLCDGQLDSTQLLSVLDDLDLKHDSKQGLKQFVGFCYGAGFEKASNNLLDINERVTVLGNSVDVIHACKTPTVFFGLCDQLQVPLLIGTFGKSFGGCGAFVSGSALHVEAFIQKARTYIYTTAMLPSLAAAMTQAIDLVENAGELRQNLFRLIKLYKELMQDAKLEASESGSHIQPLIIGNANKTVELSESLYKNKLLAAAIRPPTVAKGTSRLRLSFTAAHNKEQVARLVRAIKNNLDEQ